MRDISDVAELGAVLDRYDVRKGRLLGTAVVLLLVGIPAALFAVQIQDRMGSLGGDDRVSAEQALTFTVVVGGIGLLGGLLLLAITLWGGPGEHFEVREHGLVHGSSWRTRGWRWDTVQAIEERLVPRTTRLARFFRTDAACVIRFVDGTRVSFDNRVQHRHTLEEAVRHHCPQLA